MEKTILTAHQRVILRLLASESLIRDSFYLTGGTALSEYYLHHRLSEDLDFFSEQEVESAGVFALLKKIQKRAGVKKIDYEQSFNRNLFFLHVPGEILKTEFTFFPFPRIEPSRMHDGIPTDSLVDIAVNKLFTIYQKPRSRDFIDLFLILKKKRWPLAGIMKRAKIKFDWHIDPIQLGAQFLQVKEVKDYPRMIQRLDDEAWQNFFLQEAKKLSKQIFE